MSAAVAPGLSSPMVGGDTLVVSVVLHVDVFTSVLDRLVVKGVVSDFAHIVRRHEIVDFAIFDLVGVNWSSHVEVDGFRLSSGVVGRLVSLIVDHSLVGCIDGHLLLGVVGSISHPHLLLEIDLRKLVALLPILDLLVSFVNKMIASGNVIVSVIFDTFLRILSIKVVFIKQLVEELILNWHFLLTGEKSHISISIFYLQRPCVISNVIYGKSCFRVSIEDSSDEVFALSTQELWKGVLSSHDLFV